MEFAAGCACTRPLIAIENVAVVDVVRGEIVQPRTVLIDHGRIAAIGEPDAIDIPSATVRVDGGGRYLIGTRGHACAPVQQRFAPRA